MKPSPQSPIELPHGVLVAMVLALLEITEKYPDDSGKVAA